MTLMEKELLEAPDAVTKCFEYNKEAVNKIAAAVKARNINNIVTGARGTSHHAAIAFKYYAELLTGLSTTQFYPSINNLYKATLDYSHTLFVAVSQSGGSPDTLDMLEGAKANGALTVALTNNLQSPICSKADFVLYMAAGEEKAVAATKTYTTSLAALLQLAQAIGGKDVFDLSTVKKMKKLVPELPKIVALSKKLVDAPAIVSLSRGTTHSTAIELGLKLIETCYKFTYAATTNDFCHGPQALVQKGVPVVLCAPSGDCTPDYLAAAKKLSGFGGYILAFTDIPEVKSASDISFNMPTCSRYEAPIVYAMAIQALACYLSQELGLSPDAPRNLNKVTITK